MNGGRYQVGGLLLLNEEINPIPQKDLNHAALVPTGILFRQVSNPIDQGDFQRIQLFSTFLHLD